MVRRELGIPTVKWGYDQSAVVAVLHLSEVSITFSTCIRYSLSTYYMYCTSLVLLDASLCATE